MSHTATGMMQVFPLRHAHGVPFRQRVQPHTAVQWRQVVGPSRGVDQDVVVGKQIHPGQRFWLGVVRRQVAQHHLYWFIPVVVVVVVAAVAAMAAGSGTRASIIAGVQQRIVAAKTTAGHMVDPGRGLQFLMVVELCFCRICL